MLEIDKHLQNLTHFVKIFSSLFNQTHYIIDLRAVNKRYKEIKMKTNVNILMIDDSQELINQVKEYFKGHAVLNMKYDATDGMNAMRIIKEREKDIDLILMDVLIPEKDGIEILSEMQELNIKKKVIIVSSYKKEYTVKMASKFDVDYYMLKPFSLESLEKRILEVATGEIPESEIDQQENQNVQMAISKLLHSLGVPSHIKGYQYIRESIYMMYTSKEMLGGITKEIYPEIAIRFDTTASRVERAIRHAIEVSWSRGDYELMEEIFGHSVDYDRAKPTNSEFIATLADRLKLDNTLVLS